MLCRALRSSVTGGLPFTLPYPMSRYALLLFFAPLLCGAPAGGREAPRYVEGDVIVTFKTDQDLSGARKALSRKSLAFSQHFGLLSSARKRQTGLVRSGKLSTAQLIAQLKDDPAVESVEPNYLRFVRGVPNDPEFTKLWGLRNTGQSVNGLSGTPNADMKFIPAMELANPAASVPVVGVMDTGIDRHHADLAANLWINSGEIQFNGIDDDGNGRIDDYHGFDFVANTNNITDSGDHGTHVAGTVGATGNNSKGVIGTNPRAKIMALKVSSDGTAINTAAVISALQYATQMKSAGVNLVALNASFGGGGFSSSEQAAIQAAGNAGIVLCVAAGNDAANNDAISEYPANYRLSNMIVVAASDQNDALASFSNYGATKVDLAAPGESIYSTRPGVVGTIFQIGATSYPTTALEFAGAPGTPINGTVYDCGIGNPADFPPAVSGNIALIARGTLTFQDKVTNAMNAGATAAIIYNNTGGTFSGTLNIDGNWIPGGSITQANGLAIKAMLPTAGTVTSTRTTPYQFLDGTSMATPQVAAAVSFTAMNFPADTVTQRIQRILSNTDAKPGLTGKVITGGRLNLQRVIDSDNNTLPDWWEKQFFNQYTGGSPTADPDGDGMSNRDEFLAATSPVSPLSVLKMTSFVRSPGNGNFTIQWQSVPGKTYRIAYSDSLAGGWLTNLPGSLITVPAGQFISSYTDTTAGAAGKRFYRVEVVIP
jgi:subtilisin family serine protease